MLKDNKNFRLKVFEKASYCRNFEEQVIQNIKNKNINIPTYVSAGQEFIAATIATICEINNIKPLIFGQHRCHSIYIAFGEESDFQVKNGESFVPGEDIRKAK